MTHWTITVVDTVLIKGKPTNWLPRAETLITLGVPLRVARQWKRERWNMTVGLKRRVRENRN